MNTVKARGLQAELQDGFDLLRERGRGRFDMELPAFDTPEFSFLTDLQRAAWMPLVREILGDDVLLIHKGVFISMPGAEGQIYHQDGPHLSTQTQRPCHAVNVFIPLVDLCMRNGPTEFCLGTHVLGHENFVKDRVYTPCVPAGKPVIFDYRLGHRGLSNTSSEARPIVYCTYAAAANGKEFRDSVNFSRRRYHKLGELVEKPLSRAERAAKRRKSLSDADETTPEDTSASQESEVVETAETGAATRESGPANDAPIETATTSAAASDAATSTATSQRQGIHSLVAPPRPSGTEQRPYDQYAPSVHDVYEAAQIRTRQGLHLTHQALQSSSATAIAGALGQHLLASYDPRAYAYQYNPYAYGYYRPDAIVQQRMQSLPTQPTTSSNAASSEENQNGDGK